MTTTRPTLLPRWATSPPGGYPGVIAPNSAKQDAGWNNGEEPAAGHFNWLSNFTYQWLAYLQAISNGTAVDDLRISSGLVSSTLAPFDVAGTAESSSTKYKPVLSMRNGAARNVVLYVGDATATYSAALVLNATWDQVTTKWVQTDATQVSAIIGLGLTTVFDGVKAAGSASWVEGGWTIGPFSCGALTAAAVGCTTLTASGAVAGASGNFGSGAVTGGAGNFSGTVSGGAGNFSGTVSGGAGNFGSGAVSGGAGTFTGMQVNGALITTGLATVPAAQVNGTVTATGNISSGGSYAYNTPPSRTKLINILKAGYPGAPSSGNKSISTVLGAGTGCCWPIELPQGATVSSIEVIGYQDTGGAFSAFRFQRRTGHGWSAGGSATDTPYIATVNSPSSSGDYKVTVSGASTVIDNTAAEYFLAWISGNTLDRIEGIRVTFTDPGPRNH